MLLRQFFTFIERVCYGRKKKPSFGASKGNAKKGYGRLDGAYQ